MKDNLLALLVNDQDEAFWALEQALRNLGIRSRRAHSCSEARAVLQKLPAARLILTATTLADGTWEDVLGLASLRGRAVPVIIVSRVVNISLYLATLESGASDFIVPPFSPPDLEYVVRTAVAKSRAASA